MRKYALVIVFAAMLGSAVFIARSYVDRPEIVVGRAFGRLRDAKSFMAAATVGTFAPEAVVRASGGDPSQVILPVVFVGEMAVNVPADGAASGTANFVLVGNEGEDKDVSFEAVVGTEGTSYVRFANVPADGDAAKVVGEINGKWYSMRTRGLAALIAKDGEAVAENEDPTGKASKAAWARLRTMIADGEVFGEPRPLGAQVLGEVATRRYAMSLKRETVAAFMQDVTVLVRGRELRADERAAIAKELEDRAATLEVWIDRKTGALQQLNLDVKGRDDAGEATNVSYLSLLVRFTAWDVPVDVVIPAESTPFVDLIRTLKESAGR